MQFWPPVNLVRMGMIIKWIKTAAKAQTLQQLLALHVSRRAQVTSPMVKKALCSQQKVGLMVVLVATVGTDRALGVGVMLRGVYIQHVCYYPKKNVQLAQKKVAKTKTTNTKSCY